jgi:hypothetical protein
MCCTALNKNGFETPYKSTHIKHPCVLWIEDSFDNFLWLKKLAYELNDEYKFRYHKETDHKSIGVFDKISEYRFESKGLTEFPQAMLDEYKLKNDAVTAYRKFYLGEKMKLAK